MRLEEDNIDEESEEDRNKETPKEPEKKDKPLTEMKLEDVLKINQTQINFGNVFPG